MSAKEQALRREALDAASLSWPPPKRRRWPRTAGAWPRTSNAVPRHSEPSQFTGEIGAIHRLGRAGARAREAAVGTAAGLDLHAVVMLKPEVPALKGDTLPS